MTYDCLASSKKIRDPREIQRQESQSVRDGPSKTPSLPKDQDLVKRDRLKKTEVVPDKIRKRKRNLNISFNL